MRRIKGLLVGLLLSQAAGAFAVEAPDPNSPAELDRELQSATWPADIMRLADACLRQPEAQGCEFRAVQLKRMAARPELILQSKEVHLQRDAFIDPQLPLTLRVDVRRAALGEAQAAVRLAQYYRGGGDGVDKANADSYRYEGWLQYASLLGDAPAAYELALHFREIGQPSLAALYEGRAVDLGFVPPRALDHIRK